MRIKTQFIVTMLLFAVILVIAAASAIVTHQQVGKTAHQERIAADIAQGASELGYLSNDYLIYREGQQLKRWHTRFAAFSGQVAALDVDKPEQQVLAANIRANKDRMKAVFESASAVFSGRPSGHKGTVLDTAFLQVSWSRMAVQSQALAADALRMSQLLNQQRDRLTDTRTILMYVMVGLFGVFLLASYLLTYRRILKSIAALRAGAAVIGSGNLGFTIEERTNDEIGELSRAFNRMTADLKAVTASKADLEREVDERKRAEAEMERLAQQHQLALDAARMGWWHYDPITRIASWDDRFKAIFGVTGYSRPNDEILARLHSEDLAGVWAKVEAALDPVKPQAYSAEYRINLPDGSMKWIEAHGIASFEGVGGNRRATSFVGTVRDITERKRVEATLTEHAAKLEEINRELESFSYSVSHDLRAPLRAIGGFSQMILKKEGERFDEETRRRFQVIRDNAETMGRLIDDLLAFSRLGRQAVAKRVLDMEELIGEVWQELVTINPDREMNLKIGRMPAASGDRALIRQVYGNLLDNAAKFTRGRDAALIEAGSYVQDNEAVYYVRDNGVGFDMKFYDKLFRVFQRLHSDEEYKGTGIGLALVQRIVHRHGGRVWAEGTVDEGACFYFTLPEK